MQTKIELARPRDFGEIISDTFGFIKQNFKYLLKFFFIFCGFFLLASAAINIMLQLKVIDLVSNVNANNFEARNPFANVFNLIPEYLLLFTVLALLYVSINVMVLSFMTLYRQKQNSVPTTDEMWGYFKYFFLRVLWASFLIALLTIAGCFLCLLPGIYLGTVLALVPSIMIVENTSFGYAFNQSFRLIKDNWWVTFGVFVVIYIILYILNLFVAIPAAIFGAGNTFFHLFSGTPALSVPTAIATAIAEALAHFFQVLMIVAVNLCYFNLMETKEGTSLLGRIDQFGAQQTTQDQAPEEY